MPTSLMKPAPPGRMRASARRHMGMRADRQAGAAVDEMAERLFLAGRLGVEIDDRRVAADAERTGGELVVDAPKRVVERRP